MRPHKKSHCNYFQHHFTGIYDQKYQVNFLEHSNRNTRIFVYCKEKAVKNNNNKNKPIKEGINCYKLDDFVSEWIGH